MLEGRDQVVQIAESGGPEDALVERREVPAMPRGGTRTIRRHLLTCFGFVAYGLKKSQPAVPLATEQRLRDQRPQDRSDPVTVGVNDSDGVLQREPAFEHGALREDTAFVG